jgi:hypothetical protein
MVHLGGNIVGAFYHKISIHTSIPHGHVHRVTYARCIDTIDSPYDEHMVA